jgi:hypothetical protein
MGKQFQLRYRVYDKYDYCAIEDILHSAEVTERRVRWQDDHERWFECFETSGRGPL